MGGGGWGRCGGSDRRHGKRVEEGTVSRQIGAWLSGICGRPKPKAAPGRQSPCSQRSDLFFPLSLCAAGRPHTPAGRRLSLPLSLFLARPLLGETGNHAARPPRTLARSICSAGWVGGFIALAALSRRGGGGVKCRESKKHDDNPAAHNWRAEDGSGRRKKRKKGRPTHTFDARRLAGYFRRRRCGRERFPPVCLYAGLGMARTAAGETGWLAG